MNISGQPITSCPVCRYDLTGLPANHRCPECAFEYDETTRVWTGGGGWYQRVTVGLLLLAWVPPIVLLVMVAWASRMTGLPMKYPTNLLWLLAGSVIYTVIALLHMRWHSIVLLGRDGIAIRNWRGRFERFRWCEIWLAPPGAKVVVPPWVASETQLAAQTPVQRWWTVFARGGLRIGAPTRIYLVGKEQWKHARYCVDFFGFGFSRAQRRSLMDEIYTRWPQQESGAATEVTQSVNDA